MKRYGCSGCLKVLVLSAMIHQRFRGFKCLQEAVIVCRMSQGRGQCGWSPAEDAKIHISPLTQLKEKRLLDFYSQRKPMGLWPYSLLPHFPLEQEKGHQAQICAIFLAKSQTRPCSYSHDAIQISVFDIYPLKLLSTMPIAVSSPPLYIFKSL